MPVSEPQKPTHVPPTDSPDEAVELLDDLLVALLVDLPDMWDDFAAGLPDELYEWIDKYLEARLS
jgi:hypothetical protein